MNTFMLLQDAGAQTGAGGGGMMPMLIMLVLMFVIMYFFMIKPQKKRQKEIQEFRNKLAVGTRVVTNGGLYGTVKNLNEGEPYLTIEVSKGVDIQVDRNFVFADPNQRMQQR